MSLKFDVVKWGATEIRFYKRDFPVEEMQKVVSQIKPTFEPSVDRFVGLGWENGYTLARVNTPEYKQFANREDDIVTALKLVLQQVNNFWTKTFPKKVA